MIQLLKKYQSTQNDINNNEKKDDIINFFNYLKTQIDILIIQVFISFTLTTAFLIFNTDNYLFSLFSFSISLGAMHNYLYSLNKYNKKKYKIRRNNEHFITTFTFSAIYTFFIFFTIESLYYMNYLYNYLDVLTMDNTLFIFILILHLACFFSCLIDVVYQTNKVKHDITNEKQKIIIDNEEIENITKEIKENLNTIEKIEYNLEYIKSENKNNKMNDTISLLNKLLEDEIKNLGFDNLDNYRLEKLRLEANESDIKLEQY